MKKRCSMGKIIRNRASGIVWGVICLALILNWGMMTLAQESTETDTVSGGSENYTIAVASDLHIDPENLYAGMVNPLVMYNMELLEALLWDVQEQNADLLLLCGDITNGGREIQHEALIEKLQTAKDKGLPIYVLPGNHDIEKTDAESFAKYYAEFGYQDAYSRDEDSLSYSVLFENMLLLMIDTDGYSRRTDGAYVSKDTLEWIRTQLEMAKEKEYQVLTAGHYSILTGQTTEFVGQQELTELLVEYEVPLYLCGHLHQRSVVVKDSLTELVVEQMAAYPCGYALLEKEGDTYTYHPHKIAVNAWASETGQAEAELLDFEAYEEQIMEEKSEEIIALLKKDRRLSKKKQAQAVEFYRLMQKSYGNGTLYDNLKALYDHPGYSVFMDLAKGTTYEKWIPIILEHAVPYTAGFRLEGNQILK